MCTNKFSIGGLIGVHNNSIVQWGYEENLKPAFFSRKVLSLNKHSQAKMKEENKIKQTLNNKGNIFVRTQKLESCLFCVLGFFLC